MSNMRHDLKIKKLVKKYGLKGYGLYNLILESITENLTTESPVPDLEETCDDIADLYNENSTEINEIACYMINCGLLETDEVTTQLTCNKLYKFLESNQTRSEAIRTMIKAYKERNNSICSLVLDGQRQSQTFVKEQEQEQNKKRIEQEKNKHSEIVSVDLNNDIDEIYKAYPSKCHLDGRSLGKCSKDKTTIKRMLKKYSKYQMIRSIELYLEECLSNEKFKPRFKNFSTFLNQFPDYDLPKVKPDIKKIMKEKYGWED